MINNRTNCNKSNSYSNNNNRFKILYLTSRIFRICNKPCKNLMKANKFLMTQSHNSKSLYLKVELYQISKVTMAISNSSKPLYLIYKCTIKICTRSYSSNKTLKLIRIYRCNTSNSYKDKNNNNYSKISSKLLSKYNKKQKNLMIINKKVQLNSNNRSFNSNKRILTKLIL